MKSNAYFSLDGKIYLLGNYSKPKNIFQKQEEGKRPSQYLEYDENSNEFLFKNLNGVTYRLIYYNAEQHSALLEDLHPISSTPFVVCTELYPDLGEWWHGNYFKNLEDAFEFFKERFGEFYE